MLISFCSREPAENGPPFPTAEKTDVSSGDMVNLTEYDSLETTSNSAWINSLAELPAQDQPAAAGAPGNASNTYGSGEPLYVVDGVPVENNRTASAGSWGGEEYTTPADIPPEERKSVEVLTGPKAVELFGERARNGVILITTKKGLKRDISYIRSSGDTVYTRDDAASLGMQELMKKQGNNERENHN